MMQQRPGQSHRLEAVQHTEEVEVNIRGKKTYQGFDKASICAPLLQHSTNANEKRWGTICMQINVYLDCLLKKVQRVQLCSPNTFYVVQ